MPPYVNRQRQIDFLIDTVVRLPTRHDASPPGQPLPPRPDGFLPGDQPEAIDKRSMASATGCRTDAARRHRLRQTFTMANVIARLGRPALVLRRTRRSPRSFYARCANSFPEERDRVLRLLYDTTSPRPTYHRAISTSRRTRASTSTSSRAAVGDQVAARARGRRDRRHRVVHLRHRRPGGLPRLIRHVRREGEDVPARYHPRLVAMQYTRNELEFQARRVRVRGDCSMSFPRKHSETALRIALATTTSRPDVVRPLTGQASQRVPRSPSILPATT